MAAEQDVRLALGSAGRMPDWIMDRVRLWAEDQKDVAYPLIIVSQESLEVENQLDGLPLSQRAGTGNPWDCSRLTETILLQVVDSDADRARAIATELCTSLNYAQTPRVQRFLLQTEEIDVYFDEEMRPRYLRSIRFSAMLSNEYVRSSDQSLLDAYPTPPPPKMSG